LLGQTEGGKTEVGGVGGEGRGEKKGGDLVVPSGKRGESKGRRGRLRGQCGGEGVAGGGHRRENSRWAVAGGRGGEVSMGSRVRCRYYSSAATARHPNLLCPVHCVRPSERCEGSAVQHLQRPIPPPSSPPHHTHTPSTHTTERERNIQPMKTNSRKFLILLSQYKKRNDGAVCVCVFSRSTTIHPNLSIKSCCGAEKNPL
jgi:hypothetical protein